MKLRSLTIIKVVIGVFYMAFFKFIPTSKTGNLS